ncbi:MAG: clostripain-related cysteine peptidase [Draconibacterium sp.]
MKLIFRGYLICDDQNLIVYWDSSSDGCQILKITHDETDEIRSEVVKTYPEQNSADTDIFANVLDYICDMYPSQSFGLVLWSHGTSWLPPTSTNLKEKSFGLDNDYEIDITDLKSVISNRFDYIIFDACFMGSIEVAYELRGNVNYMLASPTETLSYGFPYELIIPYLFSSKDNVSILTSVAKEYYAYYSSLAGAYQSATISLIDMRELDKLAEITQKLICNYPLEIWEYNKDSIQKLDSYDKPIFYDFYDFLEKNYPIDSLAVVKVALETTILYEAHTEKFLGGDGFGYRGFNINTCCGLSCYVPQEGSSYNTYYQTLDWARDSGFSNLFE